jgi:ribonucleoside-triphosphate reductase
VSTSGSGGRTAILSLAGVHALAALVLVAAPQKRGLVWLMLYTIPSHVFVSPFPHEPVLLYYSKLFSPLECAAASMMGCLVAGVLDYALVRPLVQHPRIRARYEGSPLYHRLLAFFRRWPFSTLVLTGLSPIPFSSVKFLSLASDYQQRRYLGALVVGRFPRYLALAYLGYSLRPPDWSLVLLALLFLLVALVQQRCGRVLVSGQVAVAKMAPDTE